MQLALPAPENPDQPELSPRELELRADPPKAPLIGELKLTGQQENMLKTLIKDRITSARGSCFQDKWLEERQVATANYGNDFTNRRVPGTIFEHSNISLNLPKRYIRILSAKAFDELLSSNPMISVGPEGEDDSSEEAQAVQRLLTYKFDEAKLRDTLLEAVTAAGIRGEAVVKFSWKKRVRRHRRRCRLLMNGEKPVIARDGNPVCDKDTFLPDENDENVKILARDQNITVTGNPTWSQEMSVSFREVVYDGLEACLLDYRDFLCNTTERCIHEADFVAVKVDIPVDDVIKMLAPVKDTPQGQQFINKIQQSGRPEPEAQAGQPNLQLGETGRAMAAIPLGNFAEVYIRVQVDPDGETDEIACLYDWKNDQLFTYDYLCNISKTHWRPMRRVCIEPVEGRWHGTGIYKLFADRHKFCDLFFNRVNFKASMAGNLKFENPYATEEGMAGEPVEFGTNKTYRLREGYAKDDAFGIITIPDDGSASNNLLNMLLQVTQLEAGMVSAGDQGIGGLPANDLATGIKSLERVANSLQKLVFHHLINGFEEVINDCAEVILQNISTYEVERLMGKEQAAIIDRCRDLDWLKYKVKLVLSNVKDSETLKANEQAINIATAYHSIQNPVVQTALQPIFVKILKTLGVENADKRLPLPDMSAQPPADQQPQVSQRFNLAINYKDAPPDIRRQMEAEAGYQPSQQTDTSTPSSPTQQPPPTQTASSPTES